MVQLEYEAYEAMALAKMREVCRAMHATWNLTGVYMAHRTGCVRARN